MVDLVVELVIVSSPMFHQHETENLDRDLKLGLNWRPVGEDPRKFGVRVSRDLLERLFN